MEKGGEEGDLPKPNLSVMLQVSKLSSSSAPHSGSQYHK